MINNPMINSPYRISVNGRLVKEDLGWQGTAIRDSDTGEIQYCIPLNIESMGIRNNFLYKVLLTYVKTVFNEDDMFLDMKIAEDNMITMTITIFENLSGTNIYVLSMGYVNHPVQQVSINVLLDAEEKELVDRCVMEIKKQIKRKNVTSYAYSVIDFSENPKEAFDQIVGKDFEI